MGSANECGIIDTNDVQCAAGPNMKVSLCDSWFCLHKNVGATSYVENGFFFVCFIFAEIFTCCAAALYLQTLPSAAPAVRVTGISSERMGLSVVFSQLRQSSVPLNHRMATHYSC